MKGTRTGSPLATTATEFLMFGGGGGGEEPIRVTADGHLEPVDTKGGGAHGRVFFSFLFSFFQKTHAHTLSPWHERGRVGDCSGGVVGGGVWVSRLATERHWDRLYNIRTYMYSTYRTCTLFTILRGRPWRVGLGDGGRAGIG